MLLENERALHKWISRECKNLNKNLVTEQLTLSKLLKMKEPKTLTKTGDEYLFDLSTLQKLSQATPVMFHNRLKLPIYFYNDLRVKDSCFLVDEVAAKVLKSTNDLDSMYDFLNDKLWVSKPIANDIAIKYPTLIQFVIY